MTGNTWKAIVREPLLHFLLVGGLVFGAYSWVTPDAQAESDNEVILIDQAELDHLKTLWKAQWRRDPNPEDVAAIIDRYLRQEVFYREALRMNLDHNDQIVKKRLAQKMEAVANDLSTLMQPPTDERLRAYFHEHEAFFTLPQAYAFKQLLFAPDTSEEHLKQTLASLRENAEVAASMNTSSLPFEWELDTETTIESSFGGGFSKALASLPVGEWVGPVRSGLGWHLVYLEQNQPEHLPPFESVRDFVARQFEYYAVLEAQEQVFDELIGKYEVRISAGDVPDAILNEFPQS